MPISWITAFKIIPWVDVARAAPSIVQGARQLWQASRKAEGEVPAREAVAANATPEERLQVLEVRVEALRQENAAASELIASLAQQNERLVEAVDALRLRTRALLLITALMAAAGLGFAFWG